MCRQWLAATGTQSEVKEGQPTLHVTSPEDGRRNCARGKRETIARKQTPKLTVPGSRVQCPNMKMEA